MTTVENPAPMFLWLYLTDRCQLACRHCATNSGPDGTHGAMTLADWRRVLDEAATSGVRAVQLVGGEPTLHPGLPEIIGHALNRGLTVEVFSNLVHVPAPLWETLARPGVSLACSYYSDDPAEHARITGRPSHPRTKANLAEAIARGIPVRAGVIDLGERQRVAEARAELASLGVPSIGYDRVRALGRAASAPDCPADQLCGRCGDGVAAIGPDGTLRPCLFAGWLSAGSVRERPLPEICADLPQLRATLVASGMPTAVGVTCPPKGDDCYPHNRDLRGPCSPQKTGDPCYPHEE